jgi:hypothetical protein
VVIGNARTNLLIDIDAPRLHLSKETPPLISYGHPQQIPADLTLCNCSQARLLRHLRMLSRRSGGGRALTLIIAAVCERQDGGEQATSQPPSKHEPGRS